MYKFFQKIVEKIGVDKLLHCFLAGWLTALGFLFGTIWGVAAIVFIVAISFVKELLIDPICDYVDIVAAVIGIIISALVYAL
jgi:hypothetical protein